MRRFKLTYLLSGKHKITHQARILAWEDGKIKILDEANRLRTIHENHIIGMYPVHKTEKKMNDINDEGDFIQQELF